MDIFTKFRSRMFWIIASFVIVITIILSMNIWRRPDNIPLPPTFDCNNYRKPLSAEVNKKPLKSLISSDITHHEFIKVYDDSDILSTELDSVNVGKCVGLKTQQGEIPIFVHDPDVDIFVSGGVFRTGSWEPTGTDTMVTLLSKHPDMMLIDIGCNIGVYTLHAAIMGRNVIAIDANKFNLRLLSKSVQLGGTEDNVILLRNAISDVHQQLSLQLTYANIGGGHVSVERKPGQHHQIVDAITLDDLTDLVKSQLVLIKMDIEMTEWYAFKGGKTFFRDVNVKYLLMEWMHYRLPKHEENAKNILSFLNDHGFRPFEVSVSLSQQLDVGMFKDWPVDVLWIKQ